MNNKFFKLSKPTEEGEYCLVLTEAEAAFLYAITNAINCQGYSDYKEAPDDTIWSAIGDRKGATSFFSQTAHSLFDVTKSTFNILRKR